MAQFTFLDYAGNTLFVRSDAERADWTTEEYSLELEFPYDENKVVSIGQRVFFTDPSTGAHQIYEVKNAKTVEPEHFQQIVAEHICISELADEHIDTQEITDEYASNALDLLLSNTLWNVGNVSSNPVSSCDTPRGSVWQAVLNLSDSWNVYVVPRVHLSSDGSISRYIDIQSTDGTWRGVRLSIDKNMIDPSITYDDTEVVTALYGYGGVDYTDEGETEEETEEEDTETTFEEAEWYEGDGHPAKPYGQKYLEYPAATAEYGRNGRARVGFYQNSEITDPYVLLEKTWETLKTSCTPAISFEGSVEDLYRLGYADQPLQLHDIALIEIKPIGFTKQLQIIKMTVDLLDPSSTVLTIGSYIPNIVYIQRQTNEQATGLRGGGGSGGGGGNKNKKTNQWQEFRTTMTMFEDGTGWRIKAVQNDINNQQEEIEVQSARLDVTYNKIEAEVVDRRNADNVLSSNITQTATQIRAEVNNTANGLQSSITQTATSIRAEVSNSVSGLQSSITQTATSIRSEVSNAVSGLQSSITQQANKISLVVQDDGSGGNEVNAASIVAGINNQDTSSSSYVDIKADRINLSGYVTVSQLNATNATIDNLKNGTTQANHLNGSLVTGTTVTARNTLHVGSYNAPWKSATFVTGVDFDNKTTTTKTIYYLGHD